MDDAFSSPFCVLCVGCDSEEREYLHHLLLMQHGSLFQIVPTFSPSTTDFLVIGRELHQDKQYLCQLRQLLANKLQFPLSFVVTVEFFGVLNDFLKARHWRADKMWSDFLLLQENDNEDFGRFKEGDVKMKERKVQKQKEIGESSFEEKATEETTQEGRKSGREKWEERREIYHRNRILTASDIIDSLYSLIWMSSSSSSSASSKKMPTSMLGLPPLSLIATMDEKQKNAGSPSAVETSVVGNIHEEGMGNGGRNSSVFTANQQQRLLSCRVDFSSSVLTMFDVVEPPRPRHQNVDEMTIKTNSSFNDGGVKMVKKKVEMEKNANRNMGEELEGTDKQKSPKKKEAEEKESHHQHHHHHQIFIADKSTQRLHQAFHQYLHHQRQHQHQHEHRHHPQKEESKNNNDGNNRNDDHIISSPPSLPPISTSTTSNSFSEVTQNQILLEHSHFLISPAFTLNAQRIVKKVITALGGSIVEVASDVEHIIDGGFLFRILPHGDQHTTHWQKKQLPQSSSSANTVRMHNQNDMSVTSSTASSPPSFLDAFQTISTDALVLAILLHRWPPFDDRQLYRVQKSACRRRGEEFFSEVQQQKTNGDENEKCENNKNDSSSVVEEKKTAVSSSFPLEFFTNRLYLCFAAILSIGEQVPDEAVLQGALPSLPFDDLIFQYLEMNNNCTSSSNSGKNNFSFLSKNPPLSSDLLLEESAKERHVEQQKVGGGSKAGSKPTGKKKTAVLQEQKKAKLNSSSSAIENNSKRSPSSFTDYQVFITQRKKFSSFEPSPFLSAKRYVKKASIGVHVMFSTVYNKEHTYRIYEDCVKYLRGAVDGVFNVDQTTHVVTDLTTENLNSKISTSSSSSSCGYYTPSAVIQSAFHYTDQKKTNTLPSSSSFFISKNEGGMMEVGVENKEEEIISDDENSQKKTSSILVVNLDWLAVSAHVGYFVQEDPFLVQPRSKT